MKYECLKCKSVFENLDTEKTNDENGILHKISVCPFCSSSAIREVKILPPYVDRLLVAEHTVKAVASVNTFMRVLKSAGIDFKNKHIEDALYELEQIFWLTADADDKSSEENISRCYSQLDARNPMMNLVCISMIEERM